MSYEKDVEIRIGLRKEIRTLQDEKKALVQMLSDKDAEFDRLRLRLRSVNADLVRTLDRIAVAAGRPDGGYIAERIAIAALSRAEQTKPETCVWRKDGPGNIVTSCGEICSCPACKQGKFRLCPFCGKRIEVRG